MKFATKTTMLFSVAVTACLSQMDFVINPLVQMEGYNTKYKISNSAPWDEEPVYICWENTIDSSTFNILRMVVDPYVGAPELIASSNNALRSPDVNSAGDLVWEEIVSGISSIKYYASDVDSISTLIDDSVSATEPKISRLGMVYIHGDTLKFLNFESWTHYNLDYGGISNPDLANEPFSPYVTVAYEKSEGNAQFIRTLVSAVDGSSQSIIDVGQDYHCANPSYGTSYLLSFQAMVGSFWSVATIWDETTQPYNMTNPFIVSTGIITAREVHDYLVLFESDSIMNNREISCMGTGSHVSNISNMFGNDYNPQAFQTYMYDSVAVIWEHDIENGRELWWAKDTLIMPVSVEPELHALPKSFTVGNAYPNPFNGNTHLEYFVGTQSTVEISIFDLCGQLITVSQVYQPSGTYTYSWGGLDANGQACESGVYLLTFVEGGSSESRKIVLLK
ncbi:MAG: T9SS type A sorting domain-containing protein [Candidatus Marinimicrobia bacterium]|nr:T9SS type A sorting domain-containing protein [Candidatus Neomarinimicrobiota bacterium]